MVSDSVRVRVRARMRELLVLRDAREGLHGGGQQHALGIEEAIHQLEEVDLIRGRMRA